MIHRQFQPFQRNIGGLANPEALTLLSAKEIRALSRRNWRYSAFKTIVYFLTIGLLAFVYLAKPSLVTALVAVGGLGIAFAHGLELQHEALHGNLFRSAWANRIFGSLFGLPMLVSFTHYRSYHFHHHQAVGSRNDEELVNYSLSSLRSSAALVRRAWNIGRIPAFLMTFAAMAKGRFPARVKPNDHRRLWHEYCAILAVIAAGIGIAVYLQSWAIVVLWLLPWLLVAEPLHFLIELPEHMGCQQLNGSILRNTRSYPAGRLWGYLINHNNFHIEHHLFPTVPAHRLVALHRLIGSAGGHCSAGYRAAIGEIEAAAHESHYADRTLP
jgi:fatty acid desaturase